MNKAIEYSGFEKQTAVQTSLLSKAAIVFVAIAAAFLHSIPYLHAQLATPPGWYFTGNVSNSPDVMQYRTWIRQSQQTGILVENKFTSEENKPHIPVLFYYFLGKIALFTGIQPEFIYAYTGTLLAFALVLLLYKIISQFSLNPLHRWTIFLVILFGGGLGSHLKILSNIGFIRNHPILFKILVEPLWSVPVFEDNRGNYIFTTLFDTHFLFVWVVSLTAILCFYLTVKNFSYPKLVATALLFGLNTLFHLYEGITLFAVISVILFLFWRKKLINRQIILAYLASSIGILVSLGIFAILYRSSGLPMPSWRGLNVLFSILLIAYPVAWLLIGFGFKGYWEKVGFKEIFLIGWALGCILITLSGPFYPYPNRGTMTLQVPLYIIAGSIYFAHYKRLTWPAIVLAILFLGVTPLWIFQDKWEYSAFNPKQNATFINEEHVKIINYLESHAGNEDILVTDPSIHAAMNDLLWLAPEYPGKFYCGHFFLTVEYERKCAEVSALFQGGLDDPEAFLTMNRIRYIFVPPDVDPAPIREVPHIKLITSSSIGSLYEHTSE